MNRLIFLIIIGFALISCKQTVKETEKPVTLDYELINFPFHEVDSIYIDSNILNVVLIDYKTFNNPTIHLQSLTWYSFQMDNYKETFEFVRIDKTMPNRDSIIKIYSNTISRNQIKQMHDQLDNTIFGDFYIDFIKLNWRTRENYKANQTSLLDRTNSLFSRKIDTSDYKAKFPNNSTWYGIDCFQIFQMYFQECIEERPQIGTDLVSEIGQSTQYFDEHDKQELLTLVNSYTELFKKK